MNLVLLQRAQIDEFNYVFVEMIGLHVHHGQWIIKKE